MWFKEFRARTQGIIRSSPPSVSNVQDEALTLGDSKGPAFRGMLVLTYQNSSPGGPALAAAINLFSKHSLAATTVHPVRNRLQRGNPTPP